ncbi:MAG: glutathione peroxidase [Eubacteriales bacterium]|nr:glutathione peroxidase [Eubacteriales bacterium]
MSIFDYSFKDKKQQVISLSDFKGKVLLIVNTATGCGFTPQYEGLEQLHEKYSAQGLEILDFPCNQFLEQAPGSDDEISEFCRVNFGTKYKQFAKIDVNGEHTHPLYTYLKGAVSETENAETGKFLELLESLNQTRTGSDIEWNFTKFLVDRTGQVVGRYNPTITPAELEAKIESLL